MSSSSFLVTSLGPSMYAITSSANSDSLTSFPIWIPFISFYSLIVVARTSKTMLKKVVKVDIIVLFLILECFQFFTIEYDASCRFVVYGFIMLRSVSSMFLS